MSDPQHVLDGLLSVEDAFGYLEGSPTFEPGVNAAPDADPGCVQIQKACRLLESAETLDDGGEYYGAVLEHSFIAIEQTFQGYLLAITGVDERSLRDHSTPYELAKGQIPLSAETIERIERLYEARRTDHYYGTTVTTAEQAKRMREFAASIHEHVVGFDHEVDRFCNCP